MKSLRLIIIALVLSLCVGLFLVYAQAEKPAPEPEPEGVPRSEPEGVPRSEPKITEITPELKASVERGLKYLVSHQSKTGCLGQHYNVAVTSLAGLAFLANGNIPGTGKYGDNVKRALKYITRCATKQGYITEPGGRNSRMHGHGFATWFLADVYGMTHGTTAIDHEKVKSILRKAVQVIEKSQSNEGGWYYEPHKGGDEGSVTVCIVQALRAARNAGIEIKGDVIAKGVDYLKRSANPDGSFKYSVRSGSSRGSFALAAGGVSSLCLFGMYDLPQTKKGFEFLMKFKPGTAQNWNQGYPYYSNFYAALAMYLAQAKYWDEWFPPLRNQLIKKQQTAGNWTGSVGNDYCTALACLMLQIPYQYLPLFQK